MVAETGFFNNWKGQAIPASGSTVSKQPDPYAGFSTTTTGTTDPGAVNIYNLKDAERLELAKLLKSAGYKVSLTGKYNKGLADAYNSAVQAADLERSRLGLPGYSVRDFLNQEAAARIATSGTGGKKASTQKTIRVDDDTTADARVTKAFDDLGIVPTPEQVKEWRKKLQAEQKKNPVTTQYNTVNGVTTASTVGGLDETFWLQSSLSKRFAKQIEAASLQNPAVARRDAERKVFEKATKGLTGAELLDATSRTAYGQGLEETKNRLREYALEAGATVTDADIDALAKDVYDKGIENDTATIRSMLRSKITVGGEGVLGGRAGSNLTELQKTARANGLDLNKAFGGQVQSWLQRIEQGEDIDTFKQTIRGVAKLGLPDKAANLLDQGVDLQTIYSPYRRQMASLLEVDEDAISLDDPLLRSAIGPDKEQTLYDFKKAVRKDPRWQYTDNAKKEVSDIALQVLKDFGFQG
jgi:hypothetical protein